ncbi:putative disease resistance protein RGA3 [Salvia miltiorrhiza]|uniref:putative disease resistance protein RGA3 n=1 Tax=Salvia miltiorrhiza TaxID=226208 RepID=UPI0025AB8BEF|nr:putative disease resistance protein RGA3 [Salvia miltiorrhiza]
MADAVISVVVERVAAIIEDQIRYEVNLVRGVEKEVLDLSDKLNTIKNVLDDAEKRGVKESSVKNWLKKFEDTTYEMDDILDEWNYALLEHKIAEAASPKQKVSCSFVPSSCLSFNKVSFRRHTSKKIHNVKAKLDQILKEKDDFNFVMHLPSIDHMPKSGRVQSTSSIDLKKVCGVDIEKNKNDIVRKLRLNGDTQIVSIVGMGGIGKTTLAQLVYNNTQVKNCFGLKIWICVSDPFDVAGIARGIVESVTKQIIPPNNSQLDLVLEKLRDCISGKKFVLVLDDVWTEDYNKWEPLKINLQYGAPTSKILVTTRNERVAKMMGSLDEDIYRPQQLSDEECWSLMRRISLSGRSEEECREFEDIGKKIASKCQGLPLAANVLGSLLQFKNSWEEWENVWKSEIWQLEKAEVDLFPHLVLSYNELSPSLKHCFSYCAVYPKDSRIYAESLIQEWMALGYLGSITRNGDVELKGRGYFNNLAMRSLFQNFEKSGYSGEQIKWCKMHDVIHDFAEFVRKNNVRGEMRKRSCQVCDPWLVSHVQEYRSIHWDKGTPPLLCDCLTSVRVLRFNRGLDGPLPQGMEKLTHLRWLKLSGTCLSKEDLKIISRFYFLQTLLLATCSLEEIGEEIGNLVKLRNLDLSENKLLKELPESMCSLIELQILNISMCSHLIGLPQGIHRLQNLQHLFIGGTPASRRLPRGLGELSGLRTLKLGWLHVGNGYNKGLLKKLNRLTGDLRLEIHLRRSSDVEDVGEAELRNKIHIQTLHIKFKDERERSSSSSLWMDVIEAVEPNIEKLQQLEIKGYKGSRFPSWMSSPLNLIKKIELSKFHEVSSLPAMGKLPFLEVLSTWQLKELKVVGREFLGIESHVVAAFPKLKELTFMYCPKWSEWEDITAEEEEEECVVVMPCLTRLTIYSCLHLKELPHRLLRKASSSLRSLTIASSSELVKRYGDDKEGSPWRSISHYNPHLHLYLSI